MSASPHILGLDIGGTKTAVVLGTAEGAVLSRSSFATEPRRGFEPVFEELCAHVRDGLARAQADGYEVGCLSVSIGGPLDLERGVILSPPNLPHWDEIPLRDLLTERFRLPTFVEHDGNTGAFAEWLFGAGRGARNLVFLTMGTGFGGGLILDGRLYRGTSSLAGEVGHLRLTETGPTAFGKAGCWEAWCSGAGIARLACERHPARWAAGAISAHELTQLAHAGDADALGVIDEVGRHLGRGLAILLDLLNPEVIVIGSLGHRLGELVLAPAREVLAQDALPGAVAVCRVVPAELGEKLGDVAALCAALCAQR